MALNPKSLAVPTIAATANFGAVLFGLWAISEYATGGEQVALLNLWAVWGIGLGLLGNAGLLSGLSDRAQWYRPRNLRVSAAATIASGAILVPLSRQLFDGRTSWALWGAASVGVLYILGRQRARLTLAKHGATALVVTATENVLRAALLVGVLRVGGAQLGALVICGPLVLSAGAFHLLLRRQASKIELAPRDERRSVAVGLLAGLPAILAYGVVPVMTVLGRTGDLDHVAIAATLLRGPLLLASFAAPWALERVRTIAPAQRRVIIGVSVAVVSLQAIVGVAVPSSGLIALLVSATSAAVAAVAAYTLVAVPRSFRAHPALIAVVAVLAAGAALLVVGGQSNAFAFLPVAVASLMIAALVEATAGQPLVNLHSPSTTVRGAELESTHEKAA